MAFTAPLTSTLVRSLGPAELRRAFAAAAAALLAEARHADSERADRLAGPLTDLAS